MSCSFWAKMRATVLGAAARAESDDDPDGATGIVVLLRPRRQRPCHRATGQSEKLAPLHAYLLVPGKHDTGPDDILERGGAQRARPFTSLSATAVAWVGKGSFRVGRMRGRGRSPATTPTRIRSPTPWHWRTR